MSATTRHTLVLRDRGVEHIHRWAPSCSCGSWVGVFRRRKLDAIKIHRQHADGATIHKDRTRPRPRPLTPTDRLPAALRSAS